MAQAQAMPRFVGRTVESLKSADLAAEIETAQEQRGDIAPLKAENTYESVLPGVSVRYTLASNRVKEDIILANAEALSRAAIRLPKAFDYEVTDAAELLVKDVQSGEVAFMMDAPLVYDAKGKETLAQVILTDAGEYVRMEYVIDPLFMNDAVYPVTIDPVIKTVAHNTTGDTADVTYTFDYDEMGRKTTVKVGSQTLSTNVYKDDRNSLLSEVQYGNGGKVGYTYDGYDRLTGVKYDEESAERYTYQYGANGQASEVKDANLGRTTRTDYDLADRPCQVEVRNDSDGSLMYRTRLKYDKLGNLERFAENVGTETHETTYAYDRDNRVTALTYDGDTQKVSYAYDELGRVTTRTAECGAAAGKLTSTYTYIDGGFGTNSTTPLVKKITQNSISFEYEYDSRGNIISEKRRNLTTTYAYDALGQLIRVNDPHENATWVYSYDRGGNILNKAKYAYTIGTLGMALESIPYTYGDANWKDKLTAYNGTAITYDAIGNPLNDGAWTYTWAAGRQLKKMVREDRTLDFKYDHNGMRIQKVLEHDWYPETTNYTYHGKLLTHMTVDYHDWDEVAQQDKLHFFYDAQSRPVKISYNGVIYTYVHNLQGDIVGILDSTGALVVEYKYDAWGKLLSTTGSLADTLGKRNPFRYRGYVYDEESELYYLRSRYYNPVIGRFVNADKYVIAASYPLRCNTYAYCCNEPVMHADRNGKFFQKIASWFKDTIIGGLIEKYAPNQLNVVEKELVKNHPIAAKKVNDARNIANTVTAGLFGSNWNSDNTRENAFKHCLWNALMAYSIGEDLARQFGEAHEYGMMEYYPESTKMDLHNNEVGYSLVVAPPTPDELSKAALARYAACYEPIYPTGDWKIYIIIDRVYNALQDGTLYYFE